MPASHACVGGDVVVNEKRKFRVGLDGMRKVTLAHLKDMNSRIRSAFNHVKEEMEDHRESINQNTNEIQSLYELLCEIEAKVDKLNERLDELDMAVTGSRRSKSVSIGALSLREKEVALVLYMESDPLSLDRIARRTGLTVDLVKNYIDSLTAKGVPVLSKPAGTLTFYYLDDEFKQLQARENVLQINEFITRDLHY